MQQYREVDVEREVQKRISKKAAKLAPELRETFIEIVEAPLSALNADAVSKNFDNHYKRMITQGKNPVPDLFFEFINGLTQQVSNYVRRNPRLKADAITLYKYQISLSSRSICRIFHPGADCWKKEVLEKLALAAGA